MICLCDIYVECWIAITVYSPEGEWWAYFKVVSYHYNSSNFFACMQLVLKCHVTWYASAKTGEYPVSWSIKYFCLCLIFLNALHDQIFPLLKLEDILGDHSSDIPLIFNLTSTLKGLLLRLDIRWECILWLLYRRTEIFVCSQNHTRDHSKLNIPCRKW